MKLHAKLTFIIITLLLIVSCKNENLQETISLEKQWQFSPDKNNIGLAENWNSTHYNDSKWAIVNAGIRWEEQGYPNLDGIGWYRKTINIPLNWEGHDVWIKFGGVNDAYELFVNGEKLSSFGAANITYASKPSFTKITEKLECGKPNLIAVRVNDWGNSGGLWRLPIIITTDENEVNNLFKPISDEKFVPEDLGYNLVWNDEFDSDKLSSNKWSVRGIGPREVGYISPDAVKIKDGFLELSAFVENDSIKVGAIGTYGHYMVKYGYFEIRAQLQKSKGNWSAFWIQSPGIAKGEDPSKYGTEIDIFEYFRNTGENFISHNLHWAYGPNQKSIGALESLVDGVGEGFHTFAVEWTPEKYAFFVDGFKYHEVKKAISDVEEYIILSMELPQSMDELKEAVFPDVFKVDYIRVYQKK